MNKLQRRILLTTLLLGMAAAGLHLMTLQFVDVSGHQAREPDFYIQQPDWQLFDNNGELKHTLQAKRLEQWPGETQARLMQPRLRLIDQQQQVWQARAERGWIPGDQHSLVLEKHVKLQREPVNDGPVVTTERLRIAAKGDVIETDRPVVLTAGNWHFSAIGLRAELGRQQLELLGKVRGIHD